MKTMKAGKRGSAAKDKGRNGTQGKSAPKDFDEYLASVPESTRSALKKLRAAIRSSVPPAATEIISYRIPAFRHKKVLVWYAALSKHGSLFPTASVIAAS